MTRFFIIEPMILLCFLGVISCKSDKKTTEETNVESASFLEDKIIIELDVIVLDDDFFELYFKNEKGENYSSKRRVEVAVSGSDKEQKVQFVLDQHVYPFSVRVDFGRNRKQRDVHIKKMAMKYNDGEHVFSKEEIKTYFVPNNYVIMNYEEMKVETQVVDNRYDPYLASHNLSKFVNKLILY